MRYTTIEGEVESMARFVERDLPLDRCSRYYTDECGSVLAPQEQESPSRFETRVRGNLWVSFEGNQKMGV